MPTRITTSRIAVAAIALATAGAAWSHHSFLSEFDRSKQGELTGTITGVWYRNPHARYRLEVATDDGATEEWDVQATSVNSLRKVGWTAETLVVGDEVRVWGDLGHGDSRKLFMRGAEKNGVVYLPTGPVRTPEERNLIDASPAKSYAYGQVNESHPFDISGYWHNGYKFRLTVDDLEPKPTPFTTAGRQAFDSTEPWHDEVLRCLPLGLPRVFGSPYAMEIVDAGSHYLVLHEQNNTPRWIWMDGREPPAELAPNSMGFSTGYWDDDTLVIETVNLSPGTLDGTLMPMSGDDTRIVERWAFSENRLSMDRTMTIHDPAYYKKPLVRERGSARKDGMVLYEAPPCDPDGYYRDLEETGRLDEHLGL